MMKIASPHLNLIIWLFIAILALSSCASKRPDIAEYKLGATTLKERLDVIVPQLIVSERVAGVGIAVIRSGRLTSTHYYGQQGPGIPLSEHTVFNTASVAKTLTAETLIALEKQELVDFDEPIANYIEHPDLSQDERYKQLTARLLLSHRGGLLNWAYEYQDGRLAFDHDPDTQHSYSGAGIELAARYAEIKVGQPLEGMAREFVLAPVDINEMSMGFIPDWANDGRLAVPMNAEGQFSTIELTNPSLANGDANSAADDLLATVPSYAKLIEALIASGKSDKEKHKMRSTILSTLEDDPVYACPAFDWLSCPTEYGHSIGWQVFRYGDHHVITHSGSDAGENALVYFSPDTETGAVIFVNGANGWVVMTRIMEIINDEPLIADYYRGLIESVLGKPMPPLVF